MSVSAKLDFVDYFRQKKFDERGVEEVESRVFCTLIGCGWLGSWSDRGDLNCDVEGDPRMDMTVLERDIKLCKGVYLTVSRDCRCGDVGIQRLCQEEFQDTPRSRRRYGLVMYISVVCMLCG